MTSYKIRDQKTDHLLTPENSFLAIIDYQPTQVNSINSMNREDLLRNIQFTARIAKNITCLLC